jgi:predicted nucleotidyltransferase
MTSLVPELLDEVTQRLVAEFQPEQIILFGSQVWGTPDEGSDVDLLVILSHSDATPSERALRAYRCLGALKLPVDVLVKTRAEVERFRRVPAALERAILERGQVLYG